MEFWCELKTVYPLLSLIALEKLIPFHTTYLRETAMSHLAYLKLKYQNRLKVEDNLRIVLSETKPNIDILISKMQEKKSHQYNFLLIKFDLILDKPIKFRTLKEELQTLQEQGSYVGEVVRVMGKDKVLVKGVLLYGPPGTGKTLLARAVAHHTQCTFIRVSGSELVQKFIGEGSRMVRELFVMARERAPSIIFMDEIDSIGSTRVQGSSGGDSEVQRTMLEILNQLDGFESKQNIKVPVSSIGVIMATNRIDMLDQALLRTGRIDKKIMFPCPSEEVTQWLFHILSRASILKIHSRKMNLTRGIDLVKIASMMGGASGAEMKVWCLGVFVAVCTEAGMFALRESRVHVTQEDFELAVAKV
ncbi:LOW QUALITY PROTEIN: 26S proteasome regulatory subunit 8 homolog [Octopus sinensis]|uniref:LOW QUALITY PROTEIN: 26S proteasome regulatory subunit 8 homolog n=1 Tax=Octopus sinensis TaxID=2607531 RepID=A0A6P7TTS6_9MOLL|nr:LOW QUALITY PROTEIN: 26S proteasome regulatory subunit 8 homolog [Octopus sinensis]